MSEQPQHQQPSQEFSIPSRDGSARMDSDTDLWLKASTLPLRPDGIERIRPKSEAEIAAEHVRRAAVELKHLQAVRLDAMRHEDKPFLREAA